jgi:hypothetical protein
VPAKIEENEGLCAVEYEEKALFGKNKVKFFLTNKTWLDIGKKCNWSPDKEPVIPKEDERVRKNILGISISYSKENKGIAEKIKSGIITTAIYIGIFYGVYNELYYMKGFEFTMVLMLYFFTLSTGKYLIEIKDQLKKIAEKGVT